jgi:acetolactate synthase-1/2/3 large subunit
MEQIDTIIPTPPEVQATMTADAGTLGEIAKLLAGAERPVVLAEFFGRDPSAVPALVEIAEKLALPVLEVPAVASTNFPTDNALHQGYDASAFLKDADVVLLVDSSTPWYPPSKGPSQARIIKISADPDLRLRPYAGFPAHITVPGHVGANVKALAPLVRGIKLTAAATKRIEARRATLIAAHNARRAALTEKALAEKNNDPISPSWAAHAINEVIPDHALLVTELITHRGYIERYFERRTPGTSLQAFAGLGQGLTNAAGVKTANPDSLVVAIMGDGAFNYNPVPSAYGYAQQHDLPFLTILLNNLMYQSQQNSINRWYPEGFGKETGPTFATGITPHPDYPKLVEAFGGWGATVTKPDQVIPVLEEAVRRVQGGQSALVDILLAE